MVMNLKQAIRKIEANSRCHDCGKPHKVVIRQPVGGWAAYLYCMSDFNDCESPGPWDRITWSYYSTREECEKEVIKLVPYYE
jgi:hypothetical protein